MKDGLHRVTTPYICAGFVIAAGVVVACAPILRKKLAYWRTVAVRIALALLLLVTPAFGQGRFVITDGSTQSEYGAPAADRSVICPVCSDKGERSTVRRWAEPTYGFSYTPSINYYKSENRYWDEEGRYHDHELAQESLVCSTGHRFDDFDDHRCWCEWPHGRYVVLDEVKGDRITLPEGEWQKLLNPAPGITYTPNGTVIAPMSYQHPWIQPGPSLPLQDSALTRTDKDSLTVQTVTPSTYPVDVSTESKKFDKSYWIPFGLTVGTSLADYGTTAAGIKRGAREANVIFGGDNGRRVYYTANVLATAGFLGYTAWLEYKGHPKIARTLLYLLTALRATASVWNYTRRR